MNIDELCAVIRKRRKRTGLAWVDNDLGGLREGCKTGLCPIVAGANELNGNEKLDRESNSVAAIVAKTELAMDTWTAVDVMRAADKRADADKTIRAKLEAACLGPLE